MLPHGECQPPPPPPPERVVDLLVDLPMDVLDKILAGLPSRDVVRTSVLSPPWRRRWESVPGLDIELHDVGTAASWVSAARILQRCAGPVSRVSIRGVPLGVCSRADGWVRAVAGKSPRSLSIVLPLVKRLRSLFRCDTAALVELELRRCAIPPPPAGFAGFQRLTKLDLDEVHFVGSSKHLEAMVSAAAPTLVELRLEDITGDGSVPGGRWVIQAPNLRRLVLRLRIAGAGLWELGPLPNLGLARIFLNESAEDRDYARMFTAISNVRELHIGNFHMATQAAAINIFRDLLRKFENLRVLRLDGNFNEYPTNQLLSLSPFLETIEIKMVMIKVHKLDEMSISDGGVSDYLSTVACAIRSNDYCKVTRVLFCGPYFPAFTRYTIEYLRDYRFIEDDKVDLEHVPGCYPHLSYMCRKESAHRFR